ncbi:hypothetical protein BKA66DRAFT_566936 [Pyrenochaeta sp. MPI-SDFR-AT-0127]|nr:hypothetical protein BKA66DRAFT_566936 [Pyrenochaeta sp. MPI-SDFR-AT-0127]
MYIIDIERTVAALAKEACESRLALDDISGGNFSISHPGIFGSISGNHVINYLQSAVFNVNSIVGELVVLNGKNINTPGNDSLLRIVTNL